MIQDSEKKSLRGEILTDEMLRMKLRCAQMNDYSVILLHSI